MNDRASTPPVVLADGVVWPDDAVEVGRIVDAWGIKGGIKVQPFSSEPQALFCTKKWFIQPSDRTPVAAKRPTASVKPDASVAAVPRLSGPRFLQVLQARDQGDVVVATVEGLATRNDAEALKGATVFVSRSAFPTPDENEFYWIDLIGLDVVTPNNEPLGRVVDLMETGPHAVLRCVLDAPAVSADADKAEPVERLIPFVDAYIVSVSLADRRIVADWGLDY